MIQYDKNMSAQDIAAYWSDGYVLVKDETDTWQIAIVSVSKAYPHITLTLVVQNTKTISPIDRRQISISRDKFFSNVVLHRPVVNLVQKDGKIYRLRWSPPNREQNRALTKDDLIVSLVFPKKEITKEHVLKFKSWQAKFKLKKGVNILKISGKPPNWCAKNETLPNSLFLLLAHMNTPFNQNYLDQIERVSLPNSSPELISQNEWIRQGDRPGTVVYCVGDTPVCVLGCNSIIGNWDVDQWLSPSHAWKSVARAYLTHVENLRRTLNKGLYSALQSYLGDVKYER